MNITKVAPTPAQRAHFERAKAVLFLGYPAIGQLAASNVVRYHVVKADASIVAYSDGMSIGLNTGFFNMSVDESAFVLAHELLHHFRQDAEWLQTCAARGTVHVPSSGHYLPFREDVAQKALDCLINAALVKDRVGAVPRGAHLDARITPDMSAGDAYAAIWEDSRGKSESSSKSDVANSMDQVLAPGALGDPDLTAEPGESIEVRPLPADEAKARVDAEAGERNYSLKAGLAAGRESLGEVSRLLEAALPKDSVPWQDYLQGFVARLAANDGWDWLRPHRTYMLREHDPFFAPARGGHGCGHVVLAIDVSGSFTEEQIRAALGHAMDALDSLRPERVTVMFADSAVLAEHDLDPSDSIEGLPIPLGGGTDFRPVFDRVAVEYGDNIDGLIYFTDLYGPAPALPPPYPVLWACTTDQPAPWGERVKVEV